MGKLFFYFFIFHVILIKSGLSLFNITQRQKLTLSLSRGLLIKNIEFLKQGPIIFDGNTIKFTKILSELNIYFSFLEPHELKLKIDDTVQGKIIFSKSLVVLLEEKLNFEIYKLIFNNEKGASKFTWLVWDNANRMDAIYKNLHIPYNCQLLIVEKSGNVSYISDAYHTIIRSETLSKRDFGIWSEKEGIKIFETDLYKRRIDMNGSEFTMVKDPPVQIVFNDFFEMSAKVMNFRPVYISSNDYVQRIKLKQKVRRLEVNLFAEAHYHSLPPKRERLGLTRKITVHLHIRHDMLFEHYAPYDRPFSKELWLALILSIALTAVLAVFLNHVKASIGISSECSSIDTFYHPLEAFLNQCGSQARDEKPLRITMITTRFIALFIVGAYSVFLLTFILYPNLIMPFMDLKGLVQDGSYKIAYRKGSKWNKFFLENPEPTSQLIAEKYLVEYDRLKEICYDARKIAVLDFDYYLVSIPCKISKIPTPILIAWLGLDLRPGSPYVTILNRRFKMLHSAGIFDRYSKFDALSKILFYSFDERKKLISVKIESIKLMIVTLITPMYIISLIALVFEIIYNRRANLLYILRLINIVQPTPSESVGLVF